MCWRRAGWSGAAARPPSRQATISNSVISGYRRHEMISPEQNEVMTRIGPGTPAGKLLRNYWQPVALTEELKGPRPVKAVRLLGEDLVLFKEQDRYGLLARHCAHRGADLAYGRLEDGGLRCSFHGWLYDVGCK